MTICLKRTLTSLQTFSKYCHLRKITQTVAARNLAAPQPDGKPKVFSPKIEELANNIAQLNLLEVAELTDLLKQKLNLPDAPAIGFAPMQSMGEAPKAEEEKPELAQTFFTVKIKKFDEKQKVALIKEIKTLMTDMNLVQAKKFVESAPIVVKQDLAKPEADKLKETLEKVGAEVEIV